MTFWQIATFIGVFGIASLGIISYRNWLQRPKRNTSLPKAGIVHPYRARYGNVYRDSEKPLGAFSGYTPKQNDSLAEPASLSLAMKSAHKPRYSKESHPVFRQVRSNSRSSQKR